MEVMNVRFYYLCKNCNEKFYHDMDVPKIRGIADSLIMAKSDLKEKIFGVPDSLHISPPNKYMTHHCSPGVVGIGEIVCGCELAKDESYE